MYPCMLLPTNTNYSLWHSNPSVLCLTSSINTLKRSDCERKMAKHGANSSVLCPTYILRCLCKYISCLHGLVTNFQSECPSSSHSSHPSSKCKSVSFAFKFLQDFWANCKAYSYALCTNTSHFGITLHFSTSCRTVQSSSSSSSSHNNNNN